MRPKTPAPGCRRQRLAFTLAAATIAGVLTFSSARVFGEPAGDGEAPDITQAASQSASRIRVSAAYFRFSLSGRSFAGNGPDFAFESALGERWAAGGGISQAYSYSGSIQTLFTSFEGTLWYSLWGVFLRKESTWKQHGTALITYQPDPKPGLRVGLSMEQYFFNTATAAVPFSGVAFKALYELGLPYPFDLAVGAEAGRLVNSTLHATSVKAMISLVLPIE